MIELIKCSKCKLLKTVEFFNKYIRKKNGFSSLCKECSRESTYASIKKNPNRHKKSKKKCDDFYKETLADCYVIRSLHLPRSECTKELISIKREQLKIARYLKQLKQEIKNA
jgi:hypothetical protein